MKNYFFLLFKKYLKSHYTYVSFLFPLFFLLVIGQILPILEILSVSITIFIILNILFLFTSFVFDYKNTSMIKSLSITKISKSNFFLINILMSFIFLLFFSLLLLLIVFLLEKLNYQFSNDLSIFFSSGIFSIFNFSINWNEINWFGIIYGIFITSALTFSFSFLLISIIKKMTTIYIISFLYIFVLIIAGGIFVPKLIFELNDSFIKNFNYLIPHYYTNEIFINSFYENAFTIDANISKENFLLIKDFVGNDFNFNSINWDLIYNDSSFFLKLINPNDQFDYSVKEIILFINDNPEINFESNFFIFLTTPKVGNLTSSIPIIFLNNKMDFRSFYNVFVWLNLLSGNVEYLNNFLSSDSYIWNFNSNEFLLIFLLPLFLTALVFFFSIFKFNW